MADIDYPAARLILDMMTGVATPIALAGVTDEDLYQSMRHAFEKGMKRAADQGETPDTLPCAVASAALVKLARQENTRG